MRTRCIDRARTVPTETNSNTPGVAVRVPAGPYILCMTPKRAFSAELEDWLNGDTAKTLGELGDAFGEKSFAVTILLLMFLPALPLPTGGITHVFEAITVVIAFQMVLGRSTIWLPRRWKKRALGRTITGKAIPFIIKRVRWFERRSHPRLAHLLRQRSSVRIIGLVIIALTLGAALAPPFSGLDTLPALGVVVVALAIILEDAVVLGIGLLIGTGGIVLMVTIGAALAHFLRGLF